MKKLVLIILLIILNGCSVKKAETISEEKTNLRYLTAAQLYSTITTFYPNLSLEKANTDYLNLIESIQNEESDYLYAQKKELLLNSTLDLHNKYYPTTAEIEETGSLPIKLIYNEGRIYVQQISENSPIPLFSEIVKVNGQDPSNWFAAEYSTLYQQCTTDAGFNYLLKFLETGYLNTKITLDFISNGKTMTEELIYEHGRRWIPLNKTGNDINYLREGEIYSVGLINDIIYMKANSFMGATMIDEIVNELSKEHNKVIIDLRGNSGGNADNGIQFIYPFLSNNFFSVGLNYYDYSIENLAHGRNKEYGSFYKKEFTPIEYEINSVQEFKVVVLIDQECKSACEAAAYYEKQQENATLIGENTGGATASVFAVNLADGSQIMVSLTLATVDEEYLNKVGIAPDINVDFVDMHLREGSDIVLDIAINYLNETSE